MVPFKETQYGFKYGAVEVTRCCSDEEKGWVVLQLSTPKIKDIQLYVTKTGKIRLSDKGGEWRYIPNEESACTT